MLTFRTSHIGLNQEEKPQTPSGPAPGPAPKPALALGPALWGWARCWDSHLKENEEKFPRRIVQEL